MLKLNRMSCVGFSGCTVGSTKVMMKQIWFALAILCLLIGIGHASEDVLVKSQFSEM